ncbi:MAG: hypothetical protein UR26_C0002G0237 [candidate division TM6 bacterium GW2011_GWF2_32_72]|nr:MAG: hypothetical protein UR26_C0002G0237 [candidate division TM6 bacterium GW2011_GWF2_32_72]
MVNFLNNKICFSFFLISTQMLATVIGSDTVFSRQSATPVFPQNDNNSVKTFAAVDNGFAFAGPNTVLWWKSALPVTGNININSGALILARDFNIGGNSELTAISNFYSADSTYLGGTSGSIELSSSVTYLAGANITDAKLIKCGQIVVGNEPVGARWSYDDRYVVVGDIVTVVHVYSVLDLVYTQVASLSLGLVDLNALDWHPSDYIIASGQNGGAIPELRALRFNPAAGTLVEITNVEISSAVHGVAWRPDGNFLAMTCSTGATAVRVYPFDGANFGVPITVSAATNSSDRALAWDSTGNYLLICNNSGLVSIYSFDGATLSLVNTYNFGAGLWCVGYDPKDVYIAVGRSTTTNRLALLKFNGATLSFVTDLNVGAFDVRSVSWHYLGDYLVIGMQIGASITEIKLIKFDRSTETLSVVGSGIEAGGNVLSTTFQHTGDFVSLSVGNTIDSAFLTLFTPPFYLWRDIDLKFNGDISLQQSIVLEQNCIIDGNGGILDFNSSSAAFTVSANSSLLLKNIHLKNLSDTKIKCWDNTATLTFQDCKFSLNGDFTMGAGSFDFIGKNKIDGNHKFIYQSSLGATIKVDSELILDYGLTFSYDPPTASRDLLIMEDSTSILTLDGGTLRSTKTGLRLTKGSLDVLSSSTIFAEGVNSTEAISFGDGTLANNLTLNFGANISFEGYIEENNTV